MLAPDLHKTSTALSQLFITFHGISAYTEAMRSFAEPLLGGGQCTPWSHAGHDALAAAAHNCAAWRDGLDVQIAMAVPRIIAAYDQQFQRVSDPLLDLQSALMFDQTTDAASVQKQAVNLLSGLRTDLGQLAPDIKTHQERITAFLRAIICDHETLQHLDSIPAGSGESTGALTVSGSRLRAAYQSVQRLHSQVVEDRETALRSVSQVFGIFRFTEGLVDNVLEDLAYAAPKDVADILQETRLPAARRIWAELAVTARSLAANALGSRHRIN